MFKKFTVLPSTPEDAELQALQFEQEPDAQSDSNAFSAVKQSPQDATADKQEVSAVQAPKAAPDAPFNKVSMATIKAITPLVLAEIRNPKHDEPSMLDAIQSRFSYANGFAQEFTRHICHEQDPNAFEQSQILAYAIDLTSNVKNNFWNVAEAAHAMAQSLPNEDMRVLDGIMTTRANTAKIFQKSHHAEALTQISLCITKGTTDLLCAMAASDNIECSEERLQDAIYFAQSKVMQHSMQKIDSNQLNGEKPSTMAFHFMNRYNACVAIASTAIKKIKSNELRRFNANCKVEGITNGHFVFDPSILMRDQSFADSLEMSVKSLDAIVNSHMQTIENTFNSKYDQFKIDPVYTKKQSLSFLNKTVKAPIEPEPKKQAQAMESVDKSVEDVSSTQSVKPSISSFNKSNIFANKSKSAIFA